MVWLATPEDLPVNTQINAPCSAPQFQKHIQEVMIKLRTVGELIRDNNQSPRAKGRPVNCSTREPREMNVVISCLHDTIFACKF